jgi:hypothetical protein
MNPGKILLVTSKTNANTIDSIVSLEHVQLPEPGDLTALSCEAARGDAAAFEVPASGDGLSVKDEADVAADSKMLVFAKDETGLAPTH